MLNNKWNNVKELILQILFLAHQWSHAKPTATSLTFISTNHSEEHTKCHCNSCQNSLVNIKKPFFMWSHRSIIHEKPFGNSLFVCLFIYFFNCFAVEYKRPHGSLQVDQRTTSDVISTFAPKTLERYQIFAPRLKAALQCLIFGIFKNKCYFSNLLAFAFNMR